MAENCESCTHWDGDQFPQGVGRCRRYPPINHGYQTFEFDGNTDVRAWRWPVTRAVDKCGEYEAE